MSKRRLPVILMALAILLLLSMMLGVSLGTLRIPFSDTYTLVMDKLLHRDPGNKIYSGVIWKIRMPRVLLGAVVGAGLSLCGLVMQAVVQNPLAEPFLLGISAGGYLGATAFIVLGSSVLGVISGLGLALTAFIGALSAAFLVIALSSFRSKITTTKLILSGTIINSLFTAMANFIMVFSGDDNTIARVTYWTMGSLSSAKWQSLLLPAVAVIGTILFFLTQSRTLNLMLQGEETAITLGVSMNKYRMIYIAVVALLTGILVSACGIIGFVGLIVPHISRAIVGPNHQKLIPVSLFVGSIFLVNADILARTIIENSELPIGIFTSIVGAPCFAYIMIRKNYQFRD